MSTFAVIDAAGIIVNRIVLDDASAWQPPEGYEAVEETNEPMEIGGTYIDGVYKPPFFLKIDPELDSVDTGKTVAEILGAT